MLLTKPCERDGCQNPITVPAYRQRKYCSRSCATRDRMARGWKADAYLTAEARSRGARAGGKSAGERRHRRSLTKAVAACLDLVPAEWNASMSAKDLALLKVLLGRAYLVGQLRERQRLDTTRRYWQKKSEAA